MRFFHTTSCAAAEKILAGGFLDHSGTYGFGIWLSGVFVSDVPVDGNEGAYTGALLVIDLPVPEDDLAQFEIAVVDPETGGTYREWLIPAALLNEKALVRGATEDEEEAGRAERMARALRILDELSENSKGPLTRLDRQFEPD